MAGAAVTDWITVWMVSLMLSMMSKDMAALRLAVDAFLIRERRPLRHWGRP